MDTTIKKFRMSDYVKDGYLAEALRNEMADLRGDQLEVAQEAIIDVATAGVPGTFDTLLGEYRRAIRRALQPERKLVRSPQIDRKIVKNQQLAGLLDRELKDVTADELARANGAVKRILDAAREVTTHDGKGNPAKPGEERFVSHEPTEMCSIRKEHSTLPGGESPGCGYFRDPSAWADVLCEAVRKALAE